MAIRGADRLISTACCSASKRTVTWDEMNSARSVDGWRSLFWTAFNLSANPMILLQRDRVLVDVNDAFLDAFGYGRARALGCKLDVFVAEDSRQRMKKDWWELLRTGRLNGDRS